MGLLVRENFMNDIKISIVIPVYNVEKYLQECVDSIVKQSYKNIEIILVDDGSKDNSPKLCDELAKTDDRIKVIHKENGGLSSARNAGMKVITGDYFVFLDSDDYWTDLDFLKKIVNDKLIMNPDIIIFGYSKDKKLLEEYTRNKDLENQINCDTKKETFRQLILNDKLHSSACNKLFSSNLLNENTFFIEGICSEDIDWIARMIILANKIMYYDDYIYFYRENENSITHSITRKNIIDLVGQIKRVVAYSEKIKNEDYYEWYMNYCAYQYITFLNNVVTIDKKEDISGVVEEMKSYTYLLNYHNNKKVDLVYKFYKLLGYKGILKVLKIFLKIRG